MTALTFLLQFSTLLVCIFIINLTSVLVDSSSIGPVLSNRENVISQRAGRILYHLALHDCKVQYLWYFKVACFQILFVDCVLKAIHTWWEMGPSVAQRSLDTVFAKHLIVPIVFLAMNTI